MQLYRRKGSRFFWCRGRDIDGARWYESTHQTDRAAAAVAARAIERRRLLATDAAPTTTLRAAVEALAADDERSSRPPGTREFHATKTGHVVRLLGERVQIATLDAEALRGYADARLAEGASRHTVHKEIGVLCKACRLAGVELGRAALPDLGRVYVPRDRWLTHDEYLRLLAVVAPHRRDWIVVWCRTGLRYSELHALRRAHVDLVARRLYVPGTKTALATRTVPLEDEAAAVFARRCAGLDEADAVFPVWLKPNVRSGLRSACARAGIAPVTPTDLRRTYCSWLALAGVGEGTCARLLGHASSQMVRRVYAQLSDEHLAAAVARLPRGQPPGQ